MDKVGAEFVEEADAVGPRCEFDSSGGNELKVRFVIDDVEPPTSCRRP